MKKEDLSILLISECPIDNILTNTEDAKKAIEGIFKYVKEKKPDIIIIDGILTDISRPEWLIDEVLETDPSKTFMEKNFEIVNKFIERLYVSHTPEYGIHVVLSDYDEKNIKTVMKNTITNEIISYNKMKINEYKAKIKEIESNINFYKEKIEKGEFDNSTIEEYKKIITNLRKRMGGYKSALKRLEKNALLSKPKRTSKEYVKIEEETMKKYIEKLEEIDVSVHIGSFEIKIKGNEIYYSHNLNLFSTSPRASNFNKILERIGREIIMGKGKRDFIIESGHHGETIAHPLRFEKESDQYCLVVGGPVFEDLNLLSDIIEGKVKRIGPSEAKKSIHVKRAQKHPVFSGILEIGRENGEFYFQPVSFEYLKRMGNANFENERVVVFSDIHIGKGTTRYDKLESAIERVRKEIIESKEAPVFILLNEAFQGYNYETMPVEYARPTPKKLERIISDIVKTCKDEKEIVNRVKDIVMKANDPRLDNQIEAFFEIMYELILDVLIYSNNDKAFITTESTHLIKTTGKYGLTEVYLISSPFRRVVDALNYMESLNLINVKDERVKDISKKIVCIENGLQGYGKINIKIGDQEYTFSLMHKPCSGGAFSNLPRKVMRRAENVRDYFDINLSAHHHIAYAYVISDFDTGLNIFVKNGTFAEGDGYGQLGGWPAPTIGYTEIYVPKKEKGIVKVKFILSETL